MTDPTPALFDAFISYSHADAEHAQSLLRELKARDLSVWIDAEQIEPGDLFVKVLEAGMQASRCILLLVSPRSQASDWVTEEYANAMNLINGGKDALRRRLIPVLIDGAEPSGFLASRQQVDLRVPSARGSALDQLAATLRGSSRRPTAPRAAPSLVRAAAEGNGMDEVQYLTRYLARLRAGENRIRRVRNWSPAVGAALSAPAFWLFGEQFALQAVAPLAGAAVTGLLGWGYTASALSESDRKASSLVNLRDAMELCRLRAAPVCDVLEQRFWSLVDGSSQVAAEGAP